VNRQDAKSAKDSRVTEPSTDLDDLAHDVIGAAIEVHRLLGPGFLESIYEEALCVELALRDIRFARQVPIRVTYKGENIGEARLDLVASDSLIIELKAVEIIAPVHLAQVLSYLKATRFRLGLLINFKDNLLQRGIKRVVLSP
jgi:GxxExxY protein